MRMRVGVGFSALGSSNATLETAIGASIKKIPPLRVEVGFWCLVAKRAPEKMETNECDRY